MPAAAILGGKYNVQFTDPSKNTNFAYVGKRTTGTESGDYLISGPGWKGGLPQGVSQISSPNNSVLVIGRVFVDSDNDLPTAYGLTKQILLRQRIFVFELKSGMRVEKILHLNTRLGKYNFVTYLQSGV